MEQHQSGQTYHLWIDHWYHPWTCCSAGIRNFDSRRPVRRRPSRHRSRTGILPGYELALPHGEGTEDQHESDRNPVHGRQYSCSSLCRSSKLRIPDHPDLYREYRHQ